MLVLGVSAGSGGARAVLAHSDQPHQMPIDYCTITRRPGAGVGEPVAEAITAIQTRAATRGELITAIAVTHRSDVHAEEIRTSIDTAGCTPTRLVKETTAQLRYLRFTGQLPKIGTVVLYDLGSSGLTLTHADCGSGDAIRSRRSAVLGGDEYNSQLQRHLAHNSVKVDLQTSVQHKEALSSERVVTVEDPSTGSRVVLTRNDIADLQTPGVHHSASFVKHLIDESGTTPEAVLLLGGCANNPQLQDWLEPNLPIPVVVAQEPALVSARGAVLLAGDRPARVVRVVRAISAAAPEATSTSRRKLLAAFAVTAILVATITGLMLSHEDSDEPTTGGPPTPMEIAGIPKDPFH